MTEKRIGVVGIVIEQTSENSTRVNQIISTYSHIIAGRMGIPRHEQQEGVIALIVEGTTDELGAFTGKLGRLSGVIVKSALTAKTVLKGGN